MMNKELLANNVFDCLGDVLINSKELEGYRFEIKKISPLCLQVKSWQPNTRYPKYFNVRISEMM